MTSETEEAIARDIAGETLHGFRVAAWRETHPEHGDKYGHIYSEHWSTPNNRNPAVKVERLFTEDQFRTILTALERAERERGEAEKAVARYVNTAFLKAEHNAAILRAERAEAALASERERADRLEQERDEAARAPWPDWALAIREKLQSYGATTDDEDGACDLPEVFDEWVDCYAQDAEAALAALKAEVVEVVSQAEGWFLDYERQHRAKGTPDADAKANTNRDRAATLRDLLAKLKGEG